MSLLHSHLEFFAQFWLARGRRHSPWETYVSYSGTSPSFPRITPRSRLHKPGYPVSKITKINHQAIVFENRAQNAFPCAFLSKNGGRQRRRNLTTGLQPSRRLPASRNTLHSHSPKIRRGAMPPNQRSSRPSCLRDGTLAHLWLNRATSRSSSIAQSSHPRLPQPASSVPRLKPSRAPWLGREPSAAPPAKPIFC